MIHGRAPSSKMCPQLQPNKAVLAVYIVAKGIISAVQDRALYFLKVGVLYRWQGFK